MFNCIKVIDADGHVMEPNELCDEYLEGKFKPEFSTNSRKSRRRGRRDTSSATSIIGWLPFWMERLDEHYELMPEYVPFLHRKPSEVIRSENFFISCDPDEETLPFVVETVGAEHILYASDYPHFDGRFPHAVSLTAGRKEFAPGVAKKILDENPTRLYTRLGT